MARYAQVSAFYLGGCLPAGAQLSIVSAAASTLNLRATDDPEKAGGLEPDGSLLVYQNPASENGYYQDGGGNLDRILAALRTLLQQRGVVAYTVSGAFMQNPAELASTRLQLSANVFGAVYNLQAPVGFGFQIYSAVQDNDDPPQLLTEVKPAKCYGSATATVQLSGVGGVAPYSYTWPDGSTAAYREGLAAGEYDVTITDSDGPRPDSELGTTAHIPGVRTVRVRVTENSRLEVEVRKNGNSVTLAAGGGVAPYTYTWDDDVTGPTREGLGPGTYTCVVTDALLCAAEEVTITIDQFRFYWSQNPIPLYVQATGLTDKSDLHFECEVHVERGYLSGNFVHIATLVQPSDRTGRTVFEVQELLAPFVEAALPDQGYYRHVVVRADSTFCRFYLKHRELFDEGSSATTTLDHSYLLHGGLSFDEVAADTWFASYQATQRPFLTWEPRRKKVLPDQPESLYYMVDDFDVQEMKHWVRVAFADGTSESFSPSGYGGLQRFEVYSMPAGYETLRLASFGKRVTSWEVWVADVNGVPLTETRTYVLDNRHFPYHRYFLYVNSLGGVNTLACVGRAETQLVTKTIAAEVPLPVGYDPVRGDVQVSRRTGLPTLKVYAGVRSTEQQKADQDFLLSERVVLYENGRYRAGTVKDATFSVCDEDQTRRVLTFTFELPRERHYTPHL